MAILLTGFEPFGGSRTNPSERVAQALDGQIVAGMTVCATVLPVDTDRGPAALLDAIRRVQPAAVVCLGEATGRMRISLERVALNLLDFNINDNSGKRVIDQPILPGGPAAYFSTLPLRAMQAAVEEAGVPVELSLSAGAFLCNQVMYVLLDYLTHHAPQIPGGFIHLPALPEQAASAVRPIPSLSLETSLLGIQAALATLAPAGDL